LFKLFEENVTVFSGNRNKTAIDFKSLNDL